MGWWGFLGELAVELGWGGEAGGSAGGTGRSLWGATASWPAQLTARSSAREGRGKVLLGGCWRSCWESAGLVRVLGKKRQSRLDGKPQETQHCYLAVLRGNTFVCSLDLNFHVKHPESLWNLFKNEWNTALSVWYINQTITVTVEWSVETNSLSLVCY